MGFREGGRGHSGGGFNRVDNREKFDAVCSECQAQTQVPFKPTEGRAVFCKDCYMKRKNSE